MPITCSEIHRMHSRAQDCVGQRVTHLPWTEAKRVEVVADRILTGFAITKTYVRTGARVSGCTIAEHRLLTFHFLVVQESAVKVCSGSKDFHRTPGAKVNQGQECTHGIGRVASVRGVALPELAAEAQVS
jgi:hypothetical protein